MKVIRDSAEYHFLSTLNKIKDDPQRWVGLHFSLSKNLNQQELLKNPAQIHQKIEEFRQKSEALIDDLRQKIKHLPKGFFYIFSDQDVLISLQIDNQEQQKKIHKAFKEIAASFPSGSSDIGSLNDEFHRYQRFADQKMLSSRRFEAYKYMCDEHMVGSIHIRRESRSDPKVLIVEDDRFTASYTSNILSKDYDLIIAETGEEGLKAYIEYAPDIVFLDIHLPGMNGHETLQAIKAVDPDACVVMLSVDTVHSNIVKATKTGAQTFLKKPFSKQRLLDTVKFSPYVRSFINSENEILH